MSAYKKQIGGSHYKDMAIQPADFINRSEERRVGKECRSRCWPRHSRQKHR